MTLLTRARPQPKKNTAPVVNVVSQPGPTKGLNFKDSLASMRPGDALRLDNFVCRPGYVEVRKGWASSVTGFAATIESLFPYNAVNGTQQLFAAAGTAFYNATTAGAVGAAVVSGLTNAYWNSIQVSNLAGNFLICCNGVDNAKIYNGAAWSDLGVTVLALNQITNVAVWKRRVWFVQKDTTTAYYLPVDAIAGAAVAFPLSSLFKRGGFLRAIVNWTIDGGQGPDDYILFVSSMGEVIAYKGTDPASASTFAIVGSYYIGSPVGERFFAQYGGDVLFLTRDGLVPFSKFIQSAAVDRTVFLTDRISQAISDDIVSYGTVRGWEVHVYFTDDIVVLQVPAGSVGSRYQWVMSTNTGAWSKTLDSANRPSSCWMVQGDTLWMGQSTLVANGWSTGLDNGQAISYTCIPAFSYFGKSAQQKLFTLGRLTVESDQPPAYQTKLLSDFNLAYTLPSSGTSVPTGSLWDVGLWNSALWGGSNMVYRNWYSLSGLAYAATQVIQGQSIGNTFRIIAADYSFQPGGLL